MNFLVIVANFCSKTKHRRCVYGIFEFVEFLVKIGEGRVFGNDLNQGVLHEKKHKETCELFAQTI